MAPTASDFEVFQSPDFRFFLVGFPVAKLCQLVSIFSFSVFNGFYKKKVIFRFSSHQIFNCLTHFLY
jgi:hypothetical protein